MLQEIQEMGSHAKDIYDFLLSGLGRVVVVVVVIIYFF